MFQFKLSSLISLTFVISLSACQATLPLSTPSTSVTAAAASDLALKLDTEREMLLESVYADAQGMIDENKVTQREGLGQPPKEDLGNFGEVLPGKIFRGARPSEKGVQMLKDKGVRLIISLENRKQVVATEKAWAEKQGIRFISMPMGIIKPPAIATVNQFLKLVDDPANQPVYFHCMQGRDRTGTMAFTHRISVEHWKYDQAYTEMKNYGFHRYLLGLNAFVKWYAYEYQPQTSQSNLPAVR